LSLQATAQKLSPEDRMTQVRSTYYIPTESGLASFHCDISLDWKELLVRFGNTPVADDNPYLHYLNSARLSVTDELSGKTVLSWSNTGTPPAGTEKAAMQMRSGIEDVVRGFFQPWNGYMNGTMVPLLDNTVTVTASGKGLRLHEITSTGTVDEKYDADGLLTEAHVITKDADAMAYPKYMDTENGRVVSVIHSTYKTPAQPRTDIMMTVEYQQVSLFQIPATLSANVQKAGDMRVNFPACTVKATAAKPTASASR
jgi:hypothetical protein